LVKKIIRESSEEWDTDYDKPTEQEFQRVKKNIQHKVKHIVSKVVKLRYNPEDYEYMSHIDEVLSDIMRDISDDYWG
jgi:hypothetical protein